MADRNEERGDGREAPEGHRRGRFAGRLWTRRRGGPPEGATGTGPGPRVGAGSSTQVRPPEDLGDEGWTTDFAEREPGREAEEFEHAREGFRDFGEPSVTQGREVRDPYNTRNWEGGFEGRDERVAGRSGSSYAPGAWERPTPFRPPEEEWERRHRALGTSFHGNVWEEEPLMAREVMTQKPRAVRRDGTLREVAQIMADEHCGVVPVVDAGGRLLGVITDRDMVMRTYKSERAWSQLMAEEVMTDEVEAVTPEEPIHDVVRLMGKRHIRRVPVVDRADRLVGMISMTDIARRAEHDQTLQEAMVRVARKRSFWSKLWI